jgi:hypothetical protein
MLNLKVFGSIASTSKPKHTIADKGSMKTLQRFTQMEMKEWSWWGIYIFRCKWHGCVQGTKYVVDLIMRKFKLNRVDAWIIQSKHAVGYKN